MFGYLQQRRHPGTVVDDTWTVDDRIQMGSDHHNRIWIPAAGLRDDVPERARSIAILFLGHIVGGSADVVASGAQDADGIVDTRLVSSTRGSAMSPVLIGDFLKCFEVDKRSCVAHLVRQPLRQPPIRWPSARRLSSRALRGGGLGGGGLGGRGLRSRRRLRNS